MSRAACDRVYELLLASPPEHPNGDTVQWFWKGFAFQATGIGRRREGAGAFAAAFRAGQEHRRRGGAIPDRVRSNLPNLFRDIAP